MKGITRSFVCSIVCFVKRVNTGAKAGVFTRIKVKTAIYMHGFILWGQTQIILIKAITKRNGNNYRSKRCNYKINNVTTLTKNKNISSIILSQLIHFRNYSILTIKH